MSRYSGHNCRDRRLPTEKTTKLSRERRKLVTCNNQGKTGTEFILSSQLDVDRFLQLSWFCYNLQVEAQYSNTISVSFLD